jgi:hypothetical protein
MWIAQTRMVRALNPKNREYVVTNPNSRITYGPFTLEVKAKDQANRLNRPDRVIQTVSNWTALLDTPTDSRETCALKG